MKTAGLLIFTFCLLLQSFSKVVVLATFRLNQDRIARNLCVNRSKPEMKCHGKCQLSKQLAAGEQTGSDPKTVKVQFVEWGFTDRLCISRVQLQTLAALQHFSRHVTRSYTAPAFSVFRPPGKPLFFA